MKGLVPWRRAVWLLAAGRFACAPPDETTVFVAAGGSDQVFVVAGRTGQIVDTMSLDVRRFDPDEPHGIAIAPDGGHLYVSVSHGEATLWKYELPARRLVGRVPLGIPGAGRIGITPDSRTAFIPDYYRDQPTEDGRVAVVELHDLTVQTRIPVCPAPHDAEVSPTGDEVAITCTQSDEIVILNREQLSVARRFSAGPSPGPRGAPVYRPLNLVWSPDGTALYVTRNRTGDVAVLDRVGEPLGQVATGSGPTQIALAPDGLTLVVANRGAGTLSVVRVSPLEVVHTVAVPGRAPHGVTIDGRRPVAYVTYEGEISGRGGVSGIDLETAEVLWTAATGTYTLGVTSLTPNPARGR